MANILFCLSGSIACYKACSAISALIQAGHTVQPVATDAALQFVGRATLEGLTGRTLATDTFAAGHAMDHIQLSRWAEVTIICPASADRLNRMAAGLADDLLGALFLAHDFSHPFLVAPAMNAAMWSHPITLSSVARLKQIGIAFVEPGSGALACGEVGNGRLAEPDDILAAIRSALPVPNAS